MHVLHPRQQSQSPATRPAPCSLDPLQQEAGLCGAAEPAGGRRGRRPRPGLAALLPHRQGGREGGWRRRGALCYQCLMRLSEPTLAAHGQGVAGLSWEKWAWPCWYKPSRPAPSAQQTTVPLPSYVPPGHAGGHPAVQHPRRAVRVRRGAHGPAQVGTGPGWPGSGLAGTRDPTRGCLRRVNGTTRLCLLMQPAQSSP